MKPKELKSKIDGWIVSAKNNKERTQIIMALVMACLVTLWIFQKPSEASQEGNASELSMTIPKGFLVVPLELANAKQLSNLIARMGIIDVFLGSESHCLARNLRVIKLSQEDQVSFGALVPENKSTELQALFSDHKLKGALKSASAEATQFFPVVKKESSTTTYQTEDEL